MDLPDVLNWRRVSERISSSGQPTEAQLAAIKALGVKQIINLGPHDNDGALDDEARTVAGLGMEYIYIPVDFENPTEADFAAFSVALDRAQGQAIHVHCIYNARVSAFFYRYAASGKGGDVAEAFARMDGIWRPGGVWSKFIDKPEDAGLPNRYAGDEY